jgi:hypothetical protein
MGSVRMPKANYGRTRLRPGGTGHAPTVAVVIAVDDLKQAIKKVGDPTSQAVTETGRCNYGYPGFFFVLVFINPQFDKGRIVSTLRIFSFAWISRESTRAD